MTHDIRAVEYALGLYSVLIGLAVADIAASFHRLARRREPVVWDPLALFAAAYALWLAIGMSFDLSRVRNVSEARHFFFYLAMVANLFVLFLIAAASLPDDPAEGGDLRIYYASNQRYFGRSSRSSRRVILFSESILPAVCSGECHALPPLSLLARGCCCSPYLSLSRSSDRELHITWDWHCCSPFRPGTTRPGNNHAWM